MAFKAKLSKVHKEQAEINQGITERIKFRNNIERSLLDLIYTVDNITLDAHNDGKQMSDIKEHFEKAIQKFHTGFTLTHGELTEDETEFLDKQVNLLVDLLQRRGETHISDLQKPVKLSFMRSEGGDGYTKRYLSELWGKVLTAFTSDSPIAELQDRVFGLSLQTNNLYSNQLKVETAIDCLKEQIDNQLHDSKVH